MFTTKSVRRKVLGAKPKQAGKKGGGWGEGIFARLLPFPSRLSKRKAEGGFGGNSAFLLLKQNEASPATCLNTWKAGHHRKILFSLREKEIRRAQNEKSKEYFSVVWRAERAVARLASLVWFRSAVFDKIGSSQTVKTHKRSAATEK
ncbi:MAG: hypothetical protein Q7R98_01940 [Candidatus Jorgensenbacteria bacterium]|nr:hypothetical protein [Candidatus Jorgensenbacteria bacterium]